VFFEELEPLGIPDFEEFEDQQGERGLYRVFIELLWAAGAGAPESWFDCAAYLAAHNGYSDQCVGIACLLSSVMPIHLGNACV